MWHLTIPAMCHGEREGAIQSQSLVRWLTGWPELVRPRCRIADGLARLPAISVSLTQGGKSPIRCNLGSEMPLK